MKRRGFFKSLFMLPVAVAAFEGTPKKIVIGGNALKNDTFGQKNIGIGYSSLHKNTTGTQMGPWGKSYKKI